MKTYICIGNIFKTLPSSVDLREITLNIAALNSANQKYRMARRQVPDPRTQPPSGPGTQNMAVVRSRGPKHRCRHISGSRISRRALPGSSTQPVSVGIRSPKPNFALQAIISGGLLDKMLALGARSCKFESRRGAFDIIFYKHFEIQRVASEDLV